MSNKVIIHALNILLRKTYMTLKNYQRVAEYLIGNITAHEFFNVKANERYLLGSQLKKEIVHLGGPLYEEEDYQKLNIQPWFQFDKKQKAKNDVSTLMKECEKAEDQCLKEYEALIQQAGISKSTIDMLNEQCEVIRNMKWHVEINALLSKIDDDSFFSSSGESSDIPS